MAGQNLNEDESRLSRIEELIKQLAEEFRSQIHNQGQWYDADYIGQVLPTNNYRRRTFYGGGESIESSTRRYSSLLGLPQGDQILGERINELTAANAELREAVANLTEQVAVLRHKTEITLPIIIPYLVELTRAPLLKNKLFHRVIEITIYLSDDDFLAGQAAIGSLYDLVSGAGFSPILEYPTVRGSVFKKLFAASKKAITSDQMKDALEKVEEALVLQNIDKVKAERDKTHSEAVLNLSKAFENDRNALAVIGSLAFMKREGPNGPETYTKTLTREQQDYLEAHPELNLNPSAFYQAFLEGPQPPPGP